MEKKIRNVLLIEPKKCDREVLPILLKGHGLQTYVAENLREAFHILEDEKDFHINAVIISDEILDKKHLAFAQWIKRKHTAVKVLAISCRATDKDACCARKILFMRKPITNCATIAAIFKENGRH